MTTSTFCLAGTCESLLDHRPNDLLDQLCSNYRSRHHESPSDSQILAWRESLKIIADAVTYGLESEPNIKKAFIIFEYELPRERGRRPDIIIISDTKLMSIEFKNSPQVRRAYVDQALAYARDLAAYHKPSHQLTCLPVLLINKDIEPSEDETGVHIHGVESFKMFFEQQFKNMIPPSFTLQAWVDGDYSPLPSLVGAARKIFNKEPLPHIRRAASAGIPQALEELKAISQRARSSGERHLALITGVPGAGKSLLGLQLAYESFAGGDSSENEAVFLSGNGPLVRVLQHALSTTIFVQDVHGFLRSYGGGASAVPKQHIWIYDEAQRAWDAERVRTRRGHGLSEPQDFLAIGEKHPDWALMIGLIGEGQEIHLGEEAGIVQWNDAIKSSQSEWHVHCPAHLSPVFSAAVETQESERLNLNLSLRSHLAEEVTMWVTRLLNGDLDESKSLEKKIRQQGFSIYLTRNLESAKKYVEARYDDAPEKTYGLIASSKAKILPGFGINNSFGFTRNVRFGPYYNGPEHERDFCRNLSAVVTEFGCQGLELDCPIVCWGEDLKWSNGGWVSPPSPQSQARDPHKLRLNSYRVLCTRGRDGFVIYLPEDAQLHSTEEALLAAGAKTF